MKSPARVIAAAVLLLVVGFGAVGFSVHRFVAGPSKDVTCGGEVMRQGDLCKETRNGSTVDTKSYSEEKTAQESLGGPVVALVVGIVLLLVGVLRLRPMWRRRRE